MTTEIHLTDREADVMRVLWEHGPSVVNEVKDQLHDELAYTTVLTILRNLEAKGFLRRAEEGRAHRYFPRVQQKAARKRALRRLLDTLFLGSPEALLTQLVDDHGMSPEELRRIAGRLADERRNKRGEP